MRNDKSAAMPLFFGSSDGSLYGVYHSPAASPRSEGFVLCNPFGHEYMRAHRALRQLAKQLAASGFHVLRFDYRGSGDSHGDLEGVRASDWLDDIDAAIEELRSIAAVRRISILGLRLGGLFAASAFERRHDLLRLILWDPVLSGAEYEKELLSVINTPEVGVPVTSGNLVTPQGDLHLQGFTMPTGFRESMKQLDFGSLQVPEETPILQIVSHESETFSRLRHAFSRRRGYQYEHVPAPHDWNYGAAAGGILLPHPILKRIVEWITASESS